MNKIKPIETFYHGYRFRSRLEARWAVFFDACGIKYQYEPEGYWLPNGKLYLPDFYLPRLRSRLGEVGCYVEVKGEMTEEDIEKISLFATEYPILVLGNIPKEGDYELCTYGDSNYDYAYGSFTFIDGDDYPAFFYKRDDGEIALCGLDNDWYYDAHGGTSGFNWFYDKFDKARQARFEHQETNNY